MNIVTATPDTDLIEEEIAPIHRSFAGNQLSLFRPIIGIIRNDWGAGAEGSYSSSVIIANATDVDLAVPWARSDNSGWEDLDAEMMVIGAPDYAHYEHAHKIMNTGSIGMPDALTFGLGTANISRPTAHASLHTIFDAWPGNRIQTRVQDATKEIKEYYEEQLAIKDSEIRVLSNELSEIKQMNQQQSHESEQIKNQYRDAITKIPEVQQAMYKGNVKEIQFITMLSDPKKALSHEIYVIENSIEKKFPNWSLDFQYIGPRKYPEKLKVKYNFL